MHFVEPVKKTSKKRAARYNLDLGVRYMQQGKMKQAKQKLMRALKQNPKQSLTYDAMALYYENTGEIKKARTFYIKAILLNSRAGYVHNNYGTFLCRQGDFALAIEQFELAIQDSTYLNASEAYDNAGLCSLASHHPELAEHFFEQARKHRKIS